VSHLVNSPIATATPPAPKSLHLLMSNENLGSRNNLSNFLSSTGFPFCTSAHRLDTDPESWDTDDHFAHPIPSLPVFPHSMSTISHFFGFSFL